MRWGWRLVLGLALWCAPNADALAEKRVALVIGNSAYQHAARLANPSNDASAVAKLIKDIGFDVVDFRRDLVGTDLRRAIREFSQQARGADIAIVYYAGHGIELNGTNYLVPTDGKLEQDFDVEDEAVPLDRFLTAIEPARRLRLIILDACRDNPFVKRMKRTIATRGVGQGLAKVEPASTDTLIAFAAKAGSIANDGDAPHSPFTTALLKHLPSPGVDVRLVFGRVRDDVLASTKGKQEPFVYGSLGGSDVALVPAPVAPTPGAAVDARHDYELAERVGTLPAWDAFLARYDRGFYVNLAREQRNKLLQAGADAKRQREQDERRVKAAEAERQRIEREKAEREKAEREALARAEAERKAKAAEAERQRIEREKAEREKAEREKAEREKAEREALARAEAERKAKAAEAARQRIEREKAEREKAERDALARAEAERKAKAAEAERQQIERETAERQRAERERTEREERARIESEKARREELTRPEREKSAEAEPAKTQVASLPPSAEPAVSPLPRPTRAELAVAIKTELKRIGCYFGRIDDSWGHQTIASSVKKFVKYAKFSGAADEPSMNFLDAVRGSDPGVCPLECTPREVARDGRCVAKACPAGQVMRPNGRCAERTNTHVRERPKTRTSRVVRRSDNHQRGSKCFAHGGKVYC